MLSLGRKSWPVTVIPTVELPAVGLSPIVALVGVGVGDGGGVGVGVVQTELAGQTSMRLARAMGAIATRTVAAATAHNMTPVALSLTRSTER